MIATLEAAMNRIREQLVQDRRHLHANPELGFEEHATSAFVAERLRSLGLDVRTGVGGTGVVATIPGGHPGATVMLRADMDALPIQEENEVPYRSTNPGVMHACGHDGHTAILLATARILSERRDRLPGTVVLAFQPAEERIPGGALGMIADGVMENPHVDAVFGLHLTQASPVGTVLFRGGASMASADTFRAEIVGKGGHASRPQNAIDPILIASHVVTALHSIVSRNVGPLDQAVITIGTLHAGTVPNVIPSSATLSGSVRAFDQQVRETMARRIQDTIAGIARAMGAEATIDYEFGYPTLVNDADMAELVGSVAREVVGDAKAIPGDPNMASEDVSYFLQKAPGCYFNVGTANEAKGFIWSNHHPRFDIDEDALPVGVEMLVRVTERYLGSRATVSA
jgi:amidohydrolase